jgi:hypothetical protein
MKVVFFVFTMLAGLNLFAQDYQMFEGESSLLTVSNSAILMVSGDTAKGLYEGMKNVEEERIGNDELGYLVVKESKAGIACISSVEEAKYTCLFGFEDLSSGTKVQNNHKALKYMQTIF